MEDACATPSARARGRKPDGPGCDSGLMRERAVSTAASSFDGSDGVRRIDGVLNGTVRRPSRGWRGEYQMAPVQPGKGAPPQRSRGWGARGGSRACRAFLQFRTSM